jgi:mRNA-degrading endonuclease RelE of RelBE toxin-antitoxin system
MYAIEFTRNALKRLPENRRGLSAFDRRKAGGALRMYPHESGQVKALKGMSGYYRLSVADYTGYSLNGSRRNVVTWVIDLNHRKDVYG